MTITYCDICGKELDGKKGQIRTCVIGYGSPISHVYVELCEKCASEMMSYAKQGYKTYQKEQERIRRFKMNDSQKRKCPTCNQGDCKDTYRIPPGSVMSTINNKQDFEREELQQMRSRAEHRMSCTQVRSWKVAYAELADAANLLDAMMARCTILVDSKQLNDKISET